MYISPQVRPLVLSVLAVAARMSHRIIRWTARELRTWREAQTVDLFHVAQSGPTPTRGPWCVLHQAPVCRCLVVAALSPEERAAFHRLLFTPVRQASAA